MRYLDSLNLNSMNYIVTKPVKSKGIAILLVAAFGPIGMFYSTITGGITMTLFIPTTIILLLFTGYTYHAGIFTLIALLVGLISYIVNFIWAVNAVNNYNKKIIDGQKYNLSNQQIIIDGYQPKEQDGLNDRKKQLYEELEYYKSEYEMERISEMEYLMKKENLTNKIEILNHNEAVLASSPSVQNSNFYQYQEKNNNHSKNAILIVLTLMFLLSLGYLSYKKEWFVDKHSKDKVAIKEQIEKTYFGILNGAYTSYTIQGIGAEGLPFYNSNLENYIAMGLIPMVNALDHKIKIEPKNINVYQFDDDNTAYVKYDLIVESENKTDSIKIDMITKKIGGYWKLDGEKFFGIDVNKKENLAITQETNQRSQLQNELKEQNTIFWKVVGENVEDENTDSLHSIKYEGDLKYAFTKKHIYEIEDMRITKKWKLLSTEDDVEGTIYTLDKGYKVFISVFFVLSQNDNMLHSYDIREVDKRSIDLDKLSE